MEPKSEEEYKKLFTEIIKKQFVILGPDITIAKVRNVAGITVDEEGNVTRIQGDPKMLLSGLINQFVELLGLIVQKTIQSILLNYPGLAEIESAPQKDSSKNPNVQGSKDELMDAFTQKVRIDGKDDVFK